MRKISLNIISGIACMLVCMAGGYNASAQCADTSAPVYTSSCSNEYFMTLNATGAGVSSTLSISGVRYCGGTYYNYYALQGMTAPGGAVVSIQMTRPARYAAYLSVYVDWNNDGIYETTELAGSMISLTDTQASAVYTFTVPATGVVTDTNLHMRVMLSEESTGAPCGATYGQTYDFFFKDDTGCTMPVLSFTPSTNDTAGICPGATGTVVNASGVGLTGAIVWMPATGLSTTTGGSVTANPAATTVYTVTGSTTGTCIATFLDTVTVTPITFPATDSIGYAGSTSFCNGSTLALYAPTDRHYTEQWFLDSVSVRGRGTLQATTGGTYQLVITAFGCSDTLPSLVVTELPLPNPVVGYNGTQLYTGSNFTSYQWLNDAIGVTGATTDSLAPPGNGNYQVVVTDSNGCTDTSVAYPISGLGVAQVNMAASISIYPNPAGNLLHIQSPAPVNMIVTGMEGKVMMEQDHTRSMDVSRLAPGIYLLECYDDSGNRLAVKQFIKN